MKTKKKKASRKKVGKALKFVFQEDLDSRNRVFLDALKRAAEFHRTNTNDPHGIGTAVYVAISEIRDAFLAYMV